MVVYPPVLPGWVGTKGHFGKHKCHNDKRIRISLSKNCSTSVYILFYQMSKNFGHHTEILELTFRALAFRQSKS